MTNETKQFDAEVAKVLRLMINSIYTNKDIFLRELISNASDACDKLRYEALTNESLIDGDSELKITLSIDKEAKTITITDNGIGMSKDELIQNLGTIARSGTQDFLANFEDAKETNLIGQFGVGFYSSFIVADKVTVESCKAGSNEAHIWESTGEADYTISDAQATQFRGTKIIIHLNNEAYADRFKVQHIVETYSNHIAFPIILNEENGAETVLNKASALWTRNKSEITDEEYHQFYKHVGHAHDEPYMTLHNKAEGRIEYTNLLFIPSSPPFDLFHPDRMCRVKLYVKRVFITDENIEIIPRYLRFMRGIVDSYDLPLNISRETLQQNAILDRIKSSITKKVLGELKKNSIKKPEEFDKFWKNFGAVLKEGLCEEIVDRDAILDVCHFYSTKSGDKLISIDDYIENMDDDQEFIYYMIGDNLENIKNSPQLEGFNKKGIEILLLNDHVDDFWVNTIGEYKGKRFKSATRSGIDLDENSKDSEKTENIDELIAYMKNLYGEEIKDVRTSLKLTDSPVCLTVDEGAIDFRMERFLHENKQIKTKMAKILEINPSHNIISNLSKMVGNDGAKIDNVAWLLLDQAKIMEGEEITEPKSFSKRMNELIEKVV